MDRRWRSAYRTAQQADCVAALISGRQAMASLLAAVQQEVATSKGFAAADCVASPTFQKFTTSLAALQTEVAAQEVQPSRRTVWQRWSAVGRQLVERDMKGQVVQVGMIAGVVFMRTLLQVKHGIRTRGQGTGGAIHRQRLSRLQLDHPCLWTPFCRGRAWNRSTALLPVQEETVCQAQ